MGKYNDESQERRPQLVARLYDGMVRSLRKVQIEPISSMQWKTTDVRFPVRSDRRFSEEASRKVLENPKASPRSLFLAAWILAQVARAKADRPFQVSCLAIGSTRILHLPGEPFVEFQLWAQDHFPKQFVAMAGYGDCGTGYICTDRAYTDIGGYEQTASYVGPSEMRLKKALAEVLTDTETGLEEIEFQQWSDGAGLCPADSE